MQKLGKESTYTHINKIIIVEGLPLDGILEEILKEKSKGSLHIRLLKIDVESSKVKVLRGTQHTLENTD